MRTRLHVVRAGHATLQDLGRPGFAALGVPAGGAADQHAARTANTLVGNADTAPLVEVTASDLVLRAQQDHLIAVTGAAESVWVGGRPSTTWELLLVHAGEEVRVAAPSAGLRSYVALNGDIAAARTLGSVAPDPLLDFAARLDEGDVLEIDSRLPALHTGALPLFRLGVTPAVYAVRGVSTVAVTDGPDVALLGRVDRLRDRFSVTPESNHVGLRLGGPALTLAPYDEILSRGVPVGAVEIPPSGGVIVLLRARLVTAGYPVVAVATTCSLDILGQLRPGDSLRFEPTTTKAAVAELRTRQAEHRALAERVRNVFAARGISQLLDPAHASIPRGVTG